MPRVVPGFAHHPGLHCGSTGMVDALAHAELRLSEPMALGLGAGVTLLPFAGGPGTPQRFYLGRTVTYEYDLCDRLGVRFDEYISEDTDAVWQRTLDWLQAGRPVLALTDLFYLPYYNSRSHFNGHRVVVAGWDEAADTVLLADAHFPGLQPVSREAFLRALASDAPPLPTSECRVGILTVPDMFRDIDRLAREAAVANALRCLHADGEGLAALAQWRREWPEWMAAEDATYRARFMASVIEKRGNGGGLFRRMYAAFLEEAGLRAAVGPAQEAAAAWSALARALEGDGRAVDGALAAVIQAEESLWRAVLGAAG